MRRLGGMILAGALCAGMIVAVQKHGAANQWPSSLKLAAGVVKKDSAAPIKRKLIVYYLHGTARCFTCKKFETLTHQVLDESFQEEVEKGRLEFRVVNVDEKENRHYVEEYQLYSKSVVLSDISNGKQTRWKNLGQIWEKVRDEDAYKQYIRDQVAYFLQAG